MTSHQDVHSVEHTGFEHYRLGVRRHHLSAGATKDDYAARQLGAIQVLGYRDGGSDASRPLRAVLVTVKSASRPAQRIVFEDHAEIGPAVVSLEARDESSVEPRNRNLNLEVMRLQVIDEFPNRALLDKTDLRIASDVIGER